MQLTIKLIIILAKSIKFRLNKKEVWRGSKNFIKLIKYIIIIKLIKVKRIINRILKLIKLIR